MADPPDNNQVWPDPQADGPLMPSEVGRYVGLRIAAFRQDAGLSQRDLAKLLGVSQQTVSHWESGQREPTLTNLVALANTFTVPLVALLPWRESDIDWLARWLAGLHRPNNLL